VIEALINAFRAPDIRRRIIFVLAMLVVYRLLAVVPVPSVDRQALDQLINDQTFLQLLDLFSGGGLRSFSIVAMGVNPYINASIIIQLLTAIFPQLEQLSKEGEYGRYKINQYTRFLTAPLTIVQAIGIFVLLKNQKIIGTLAPLEFFSFILTMVAGTFILVWFGELVSEFGLGNGISLLIFAGIVGRIPVVLGRTLAVFNQELIFNMIIFAVLSILLH